LIPENLIPKTMKILCVSDQIDPLVYSTTVKERYRDVDFVISAGDLPMEYLDFIVSAMNKPVYFVFGNHNLNEFGLYHRNEAGDNQSKSMAPYPFKPDMGHGATYLGFTTKREGKILMAGVSGSRRYNNGLNQYTEAQMKWRLLKLVPRLLLNKLRFGRYLDILVTHASPAGIHDKSDPCHQGFECFKWFMDSFSPRYLVHGHIHLYDLQDIRVSKYHDTTVINAYSHFILDTGETPS